MHFEPIIINEVFNKKDVEHLKAVLASGNQIKDWKDIKNRRKVLRFRELDDYFSKKLEPLAKKIFNDENLKSTYAVYLDYDQPTSRLPMHKDNNACTYTIDYCVSSKNPWGIIVENQEFFIGDNQGLAFMGGYDSHGRGDMPDPENNRVEIVMFHFCPLDHWYFTEGEDYLYYLMDNDLLPEGDSYHLSPALTRKNVIDY